MIYRVELVGGAKDGMVMDLPDLPTHLFLPKMLGATLRDLRAEDLTITRMVYRRGPPHPHRNHRYFYEGDRP